MSLQIYDARVHHNDPGQLVRPEPMGKAQMCLNAGNFITLAMNANGSLMVGETYSYVASCFKNKTPVKVNAGGDDFDCAIPQAPLSLIEIDGEGWFTPIMLTSPIELKSITGAIKQQGYRMTCSPPDPFGMTLGGKPYGMTDDSWLKRETYIRDDLRLAEMKAWKKLHQTWINDLYALTFCVYFDIKPEDDEIWIAYLSNALHAIRDVYGRSVRIFCHTWAHRNGAPYPPLTDAQIQRWAGALMQASDQIDTDLSGVIVWNDDANCGTDATAKLLKALGVEGIA